MSADLLSLVRWLVSPEAERWLTEIAASQESLTAQAQRLRRTLSAAQTHAVLEQVDLRRRAAAKFSHAARMFFTRQALEQSTSETVAQWKARRLAETIVGARQPDAKLIADLCCGMGGDLLALAQVGAALGVERDAVIAELARANLAALGRTSAKVRCDDVRNVNLETWEAWHLDPDRRARARRVSQPEFAEPGLETIQAFLKRNPHGAIKLAPAAHIPEAWLANSEREWISEQGECKQQVAWFGRFVQWPGQRSATVLSRHAPPRTLHGHGAPWAINAHVGEYVYEPDAGVLAAGLAGELAAEHAAHALGPEIAYFSSDHPVDDPAWVAFRVVEVAPFDRKRLKAMLRQRRIGRLEVKKRGVDVDVERLRRELRVPGDEAATLLIAPIAGQVTVILADPLVGESLEGSA